MATSKILTRCVRMETTPPVLLVCIEIECEGCGDYTIVLLGHHVKALLQALQEVVAHEPELTDGGTIDVLYRRFQQHTPGLN